MRQGRIYIAGPIEGIKDFNAIEFAVATNVLKDYGWVPFSTLEKDSLSSTGDEAALSKAGFSRRVAFSRGMGWICSHADAIYMLSGWEASLGAQAEWALARALPIQIYYAPEMPISPKFPI